MMYESEKINELTEALLSVGKHLKNVEPNMVNGGFKSKYADLGAVINECKEPLLKNQILVLQRPIVLEGKQYLETRLIHVPSQQWLSSMYILSPEKNGLQEIGKGMTYLRRYSLVSLLNMYIGDDDDGEEDRKRHEEQKKKDVPVANKNNSSLGSIRSEQVSKLKQLLKELDDSQTPYNMCKYYKVDSIQDLPEDKYLDAMRYINKKIEAKNAKTA